MENIYFPGEFILIMAGFAYLWISGVVCCECSNELKQGVRRVKRIVWKGK